MTRSLRFHTVFARCLLAICAIGFPSIQVAHAAPTQPPATHFARLTISQHGAIPSDGWFSATVRIYSDATYELDPIAASADQATARLTLLDQASRVVVLRGDAAPTDNGDGTLTFSHVDMVRNANISYGRACTLSVNGLRDCAPPVSRVAIAPGADSRLRVIAANGATIVADTAFAVLVEVTDSHGNNTKDPNLSRNLSLTLSDAAGRAVALSTDPVTVTRADGHYKLSNVNLVGNVGIAYGPGATLRATASLENGATINGARRFEIVGGAASSLTFLKQPKAKSDVSDVMSASVHAFDANGNTVADGTPVSLDLVGNGQLVGDTTQYVTGTRGIATFNNIGVSDDGRNDFLAATSNLASAAYTDRFEVIGCFVSLTVSPSSLADGTVAVPFDQTISASGGNGSYTYAVTSGALPAGVTLSTDGELNGTPTAGGTFFFTITATDTNFTTGSRPYTWTIDTPTITVSPSTLPDPAAETAYSQSVSASGGTEPYTYTVDAGALPTGLTLDPDTGLISGTTTVAGLYDYTIKATDSSTGTGPYNGTKEYSGTVSAPTITLSPTSLPSGTVAVAYSQSVSASGGATPYSYAVTAGSLPTGLTLGSGGTIAGTPTAGGTFNFTITATDDGLFTGSHAYPLVISAPTIAVSPSTLPDGAISVSYSQTVSASAGIAPYTYTVDTGALPTGLSLDGATGIISGTPTAGGSFDFTIKATDSSTGTGPYNGTQAYTVHIPTPTVVVSPTSLPAPLLNIPYVTNITASGGTPPYTFAVTAGTPPTGLTLAANGALTGTPTANGTFTFTVTATDSSTGTGPFTGAQAYSVTVTAGTITVTPTSLPAATDGGVYSQNFAASGGIGPYTFAVTSGVLPAGLSLSAGGALTGKPTEAGTFAFTVTATDSRTGAGSPFTGSVAITLTVNPPTIVITPPTLPAGKVGIAYGHSVAAAGGTAPYSFSAAPGSLPDGLSLSAAGLISGTPTGGGTFHITVTATDSSTGAGAPFSGSRAITLVIAAPTIGLGPGAIPTAQVGVPYSQTFTVTGTGSAPIAITVASGALPAGLTLTGGVIAGTPTAGGTFVFTLKATDSSTGAGPYNTQRTITLVVLPPIIAVHPGTLPTCTVGIPYLVTFSVTGTGTEPITFHVTDGHLPPGLTLTGDGNLTGTPTGGGTFGFKVVATDSSTGTGPYSGVASYVLGVQTPAIVLSPASLPQGSLGAAYSASITASGGTSPYTFSAPPAGLPAGLTLAPDGTVSGTPTATGSFTFTVTALDSSANLGPYSGSQTYTVQIVAHTFPAGLALFSVPSSYPGQTVASVLGYDSPVLARWNPTTAVYDVTPSPAVASLVAGPAYWVRFPAVESITMLGTPTPTSAPFDIALHTGWNMIGDPFPADEPFANIAVKKQGNPTRSLTAAMTDGTVSSAIYAYTGGAYTTVNHLTPYSGYWVYVFTDCTFSISPP